MKTEDFFARLDGYFAKNELEKVEPFLLQTLEEAREDQDYGLYLSVGNEMIGFYRSISQFKKAFAISEDVLILLEELQLDGTEHFATTLLNVATVYRAAGREEESYAYYMRALQLYERLLPPGDYRFAGLYNNLSLLLERLGREEDAADYLQKALVIVTPMEDSQMERATTLTNLAMLELKTQQLCPAKEHLQQAVELFSGAGPETDAHYSAALAGMGEVCFRLGEYETALDFYEKALLEVKKHFGENASYQLLCENCSAVCAQLKDTKKQEQYSKKALEVKQALEKESV